MSNSRAHQRKPTPQLSSAKSPPDFIVSPSWGIYHSRFRYYTNICVYTFFVIYDCVYAYVYIYIHTVSSFGHTHLSGDVFPVQSTYAINVRISWIPVVSWNQDQTTVETIQCHMVNHRVSPTGVSVKSHQQKSPGVFFLLLINFQRFRSAQKYRDFLLTLSIQDPSKYSWLVVGEKPLWKIWVRQLGWWQKPNINGKIKNGNQTTNQNMFNSWKWPRLKNFSAASSYPSLSALPVANVFGAIEATTHCPTMNSPVAGDIQG